MDDLYREIIVERYKSPIYRGTLIHMIFHLRMKIHYAAIIFGSICG